MLANKGEGGYHRTKDSGLRRGADPRSISGVPQKKNDRTLSDKSAWGTFPGTPMRSRHGGHSIGHFGLWAGRRARKRIQFVSWITLQQSQEMRECNRVLCGLSYRKNPRNSRKRLHWKGQMLHRKQLRWAAFFRP